MKKISKIDGIIAPLKHANVDTDIIMPKQFLKSIKRTGYGQHIFDAWRYDDMGVLGMDCSKRPLKSDFVLNQPAYKHAKILLTEKNFGCGSSREHAVWGLVEYGIEAVIAPSFAEIFYHNAIKNGLLPVVLSEEAVSTLMHLSLEQPGVSLQVDLSTQSIICTDLVFEFKIELADKHKLLNGLDDVALTLQYADKIKAYEKNRAAVEPWIFADNEI
jgi:3-isopropylmalate/(R)-2-methylmalate dehydratase small subunit